MTEYLGHELVNYQDRDIVECKKCKVKLFEDIPGKEYSKWDPGWFSYKLTCEEQIIKNIIE